MSTSLSVGLTYRFTLRAFRGRGQVQLRPPFDAVVEAFETLSGVPFLCLRDDAGQLLRLPAAAVADAVDARTGRIAA